MNMGSIRFLDTNEVIVYTNEDDFLNDIEELLYFYGFNGWKYNCLGNKDLEEKVYVLISNEFGY